MCITHTFKTICIRCDSRMDSKTIAYSHHKNKVLTLFFIFFSNGIPWCKTYTCTSKIMYRENCYKRILNVCRNFLTIEMLKMKMMTSRQNMQNIIKMI